MALGGGCVVFIQSSSCPQLPAGHLAQGIFIYLYSLGLMLLLGLHFHPRAIPSFPSPCLMLPELPDLAAHGDAGDAQQVVSQAQW